MAYVEKPKVTVQPIGVVKPSQAGTILGDAISRNALDLSKIAFTRAAEEAKKYGTEAYESAPEAQIRTIDPATGLPKLYKAPPEMGVIAQEHYQNGIKRRFLDSIVKEIKISGKEIEFQTRGSPNRLASFTSQFQNKLNTMAEHSKGWAKEFIETNGADYLRATATEIQRQVMQASQAEQRKDINLGVADKIDSYVASYNRDPSSGFEDMAQAELKQEIISQIDEAESSNQITSDDAKILKNRLAVKTAEKGIIDIAQTEIGKLLEGNQFNEAAQMQALLNNVGVLDPIYLRNSIREISPKIAKDFYNIVGDLDSRQLASVGKESAPKLKGIKAILDSEYSRENKQAESNVILADRLSLAINNYGVKPTASIMGGMELIDKEAEKVAQELGGSLLDNHKRVNVRDAKARFLFQALPSFADKFGYNIMNATQDDLKKIAISFITGTKESMRFQDNNASKFRDAIVDLVPNMDVEEIAVMANALKTIRQHSNVIQEATQAEIKAKKELKIQVDGNGSSREGNKTAQQASTEILRQMISIPWSVAQEMETFKTNGLGGFKEKLMAANEDSMREYLKNPNAYKEYVPALVSFINERNMALPSVIVDNLKYLADGNANTESERIALAQLYNAVRSKPGEKDVITGERASFNRMYSSAGKGNWLSTEQLKTLEEIHNVTFAVSPDEIPMAIQMVMDIGKGGEQADAFYGAIAKRLNVNYDSPNQIEEEVKTRVRDYLEAKYSIQHHAKIEKFVISRAKALLTNNRVDSWDAMVGSLDKYIEEFFPQSLNVVLDPSSRQMLDRSINSVVRVFGNESNARDALSQIEDILAKELDPTEFGIVKFDIHGKQRKAQIEKERGFGKSDLSIMAKGPIESLLWLRHKFLGKDLPDNNVALLLPVYSDGKNVQYQVLVQKWDGSDPIATDIYINSQDYSKPVLDDKEELYRDLYYEQDYLNQIRKMENSIELDPLVVKSDKRDRK